MNKLLKSFCFSIGLLFIQQSAYGQLKIGGNPALIEASSILELEAKDRGLLIPRMTTLQRDSISAAVAFRKDVSQGLMVYNTDQSCLNFYDSLDAGRWINMCRVYIPYADTTANKKKSPAVGDIVIDSDCDCIMHYDSNYKWKPLVGQQSGFEPIELHGDSVYLLSIAAIHGDTLVFTFDNLLGIGVGNPIYAVDVEAEDSLLLRLSHDEQEILSVEDALVGGLESTILTSQTQPLVLRVEAADSNQYILLDTNGSIDLSKYGRGNFGTKSPSYLLGVDSAGNLVEFTGFTAISSSDRRLKRDILPLTNTAEALYQLNGVSYYWKHDVHSVRKFDDELTYGVIAQEVEKVFPNLVMEDDQGFKMVNYMGFVPLLMENQKQQHDEIERLKTENKELKQRLERLENYVYSQSQHNVKQ